jgi:adenosylcobinamide kinase/adenosylcobinamide-phosphate guanylyltransferase
LKGLTLVIGGARSGKSAYAEKLATSLSEGREVVYVATMTALDEELAARIARHRAGRPSHWRTIEEPLDVASRLRADIGDGSVVLIDCVTLLITNHLMLDPDARADAIERKIELVVDDLIAAVRDADAAVIAVSNEVGLSIVPEYPLGRLFRDLAGRANQRLAAASDRVVFMVAGIPMEIKSQ